MDNTYFRTGTPGLRNGGVLSVLVRALAAAAAVFALLTIMLIGLFVLLPLLLAGGTALYLYLRRRARQNRGRPADGIIDAEYTIIDR
ncbi:hypothetical protein HPT29_011520 [Microvirga terrae]|uniref:Uncharacterized protein n=1 Tax=Microvirga terrae TaxID=2740529 RepID=A0ABY5RWR7_9HYPH|nr:MULTISPECIES: hypothetical protein [Microvirga]MBQ0821411.1 hypothetical protein [Microvirga sp. HBU67558]UVF21701.1 hypothetical protein HPT29_011520 [Microvirga terrae]